MNIVLLSGGIGRRLWPISNEERPKQFVKLNNESMLQRNYRLLETLKYNIYIESIEKYKEIIQSQIGKESKIIIEPERRDTFPAICNGAEFLYNEGIDENEYIIFVPIDAWVEQEFYKEFEIFENSIKKSNANIGLIGIKPIKPSTEYGYITIEKSEKAYSYVKNFKEKPTKEELSELINNGALINSGIFIVKVQYIKKIIKKYIRYSSYNEFLIQYNKLPYNSFDFEILEKEKGLITFNSSYTWQDVGSWTRFVEQLQNENYGQVYSYNNKNTNIINELDIPIRAIGNQNIIISASKEGILICNKSEIQNLKEYL